MLSTPVLFLIFNRPDTTEKVFEQIRKAKPKKFYVAADGPRTDKQSEVESCSNVRNLVLENIDWECNVKTLFRHVNLGCKDAVSSAITWFFENEEEGIILEDDCLPSQTFFPFCEKMLSMYRNDKRVFQIAGLSLLEENKCKADYFFSTISSIWGWATWRDRWQGYSANPVFKEEYFDGIKDNYVKHYFYSMAKNHSADTWDIQWFYHMLKNKGLAVIPSVNFISNIGLTGTNALSGKASSSQMLPVFEKDLDLIAHPNVVVADKKLDKEFCLYIRKAIGANILPIHQRIIRKVKKLIHVAE